MMGTLEWWPDVGSYLWGCEDKKNSFFLFYTAIIYIGSIRIFWMIFFKQNISPLCLSVNRWQMLGILKGGRVFPDKPFLFLHLPWGGRGDSSSQVFPDEHETFYCLNRLACLSAALAYELLCPSLWQGQSIINLLSSVFLSLCSYKE